MQTCVCPPPEHHLHRTTELVKRLNCQIEILKQTVADLEKELASKTSADRDCEIRSLRTRLGYKDSLLELKDEMLQISSREHMRFMKLYLDRNGEMTTLRETNQTLVKKLLN